MNKEKKKIEQAFKAVIGKTKSNEDFTKELNVESSDWSYGHSRGYNQCLKDIEKRMKEFLKNLK